MWANLLQLLAFLFINRKLQNVKQQFVQVREGFADYTEDRASKLKQDFVAETQRLATSLVSVLLGFSLLIFSGVLGLMWLFSLLWAHPQRTVILGCAMLLPLSLAILIAWRVYRHWQRQPLFQSSLQLISDDWQTFRQPSTDATSASAHTHTQADTPQPAAGSDTRTEAATTETRTAESRIAESSVTDA